MPSDGDGRRGPCVRIGASGNASAELVETISIARRPDANRTVVMSLDSEAGADLSLPDLRPGDRLEVAAEVEVTTDLQEDGPGCVGKPYRYAPRVGAQLLLARGPDVAAAGARRALALARTERETVTHEQHHRVLVLEQSLDIPPQGLPWSRESHLNLVLDASHPDAGPDHVLLVGQNEPDGTVLGDMGQIAVLRLRPARQARPTPTRGGPLVGSIPIQKGARTVVFSQRLDGLAVDDQLRVRARLETSAARLGYPARISTRVFLAASPDQDEPGGVGAQVASFKGQVTKANGFNCTPDVRSTSTRKAGVLRITARPRGPLYVNLVAVGADPLGRGTAGDRLRVTGGRCEVVRFPAAMLR